MRVVDAAWPEVGAKLHHSFGVWPALINGVTVAEEYQPPRRMTTRPKGWPLGESRVVIDVSSREDTTLVRLREWPVSGPGRWAPRLLVEAGLYWRNRETLRRLAFLAEGRAAQLGPDRARYSSRTGSLNYARKAGTL